MGTNAITLESLGFSQEELQERVIARLCDQIMESIGYDEDDGEFSEDSRFNQRMKEAALKRIDQKINELAEKHVLPNVAQYIETLTLQSTNKWGEKVGKSLTFIEYLTSRADAYMREEVSHDGKAKGEDSYSWRPYGTRVAYMIDKHLQFSIKAAMEKALQVANSSIADGIEATVKMKLQEILAGIKTTVKVTS